MEINTGIPEEERKKVAEGLSHLLADSYTLYLKTHNFHWNVTGPMFQSLHAMFEEHYTELATAVDEIAERIRENVVSTNFELGEDMPTLPVTVSIGVSALDDPEDQPDDILKRADLALYDAKNGGRNRVVKNAA